MSKYEYIGKKIPRVDGLEKATGATKYMTDLDFPGALYGKVRYADHAHAIINSIDLSQAEKMPGVHGIYTAKDVPGKNLRGIIGHKNREVFASDKTRYLGDALAFVVADTLPQAEAAAAAIQVDYTPLPVYTDPREAMKPDAVQIHPEGNVLDHAETSVGDVDLAFRQADYVMENTYYTHRQHHAYIETLGGYAVPDADGGVSIYCPAQNPYGDIAQLSAILELPEDKIRIIGSPGGGSFGGKDNLYFQPYMAIAALRLQRPVFVHADREETMLIGVCNQPFIYTMRTAYMKDGTLVGQDVEVICDSGAYSGLSLVITRGGLENLCGSYRIPNIRCKGYTVHTNQQFTGEWRGFGNNPTHFALESQMDRIAQQLGMDPVELRLKNMQQPGDSHPLGHQQTNAISCARLLRLAADDSPWAQREQFKSQPSRPWKKRGVGLACCIQPYTENYAHNGGLSVDRDGAYTIHCSTMEHGAGTGTALCIMVAESMGVPLEQVTLNNGRSTNSNNSGPITAARTNYAMGNCMLMNVDKMKKRLLNCAHELYGYALDSLVWQDGRVLSLDEGPVDMARIWAKLNDDNNARVDSEYEVKHPNAGGGLPDRHRLWAFMTQIIGVEVDQLTGKVDVLFADSYVDAGQVINKLGFEGQVDGGLLIGLGMATMEDMTIGAQGQLLTNSLQTYLVPTAADMPELRLHSCPTVEESGPFGAKGIGEMPAVTIVPATLNAIYDAVGVRINELPASPERVYMALKQQQK